MPPQYHAFNTQASAVSSSSSSAPYRVGDPSSMNNWSPHIQHQQQAMSGPSGGNNTNDGYQEDDGDEEDEEDEEDYDEDDDAEQAEENANLSTAASTAANKKRKREQLIAVKTEDGRAAVGNGAKKPKPTRGSKACKNCRRLKMRCVGAENGPPCNRCSHTGHECVFEESNRGKKGGKNQRAEMAQSLKKMEQTLATVLRTIRDPSSVAAQTGGMLTRSPSPTTLFPSLRNLTEAERERITSGWRSRDPPAEDEVANRNDSPASASQVLAPVGSKPPTPMPWIRSMSDYASPGGKHVDPSAFASASGAMSAPSTGTPPATSGTRFLEPVPHYHSNDPTLTSKGGGPPPRDRWRSVRHTSPRLHSLPDNTLNPLGLLAEASLHNSHRLSRKSKASSSSGDSSRGKERSVSLSGISPRTPVVRIDGESPSGSINGVSPGNVGEMASPAATGEGGASANASASAGTSKTTDGSAEARQQQELDPYKTRRDEDERVSLGVASETYFKPGPMTILPLRRIIIERERPPEILTEGIVSSHEVLELFQIFFHHCAQHMLLLDPDWHTPSMIFSRSPFLFTVVCAVASRFYTKRPELYATCLSLAKKVALDCISRGYKSVEIVQGFLLLCMWNQPAERWEEDKTWLFSGVAIRVATDLNLHRKSVASLPNSSHADDPSVLEREREILNRERTWYLCYAVDRSLSVQMGKPYSIREDWIIRNCRLWSSQRLSKPWDVGISALVDLQRMQSRQLDFLYSSTSSVSGLNTDIDYTSVLTVFNEQLDEWNDLWQSRGIIGKAAAVHRAAERAQTQAAATQGSEGDPSAAATQSEDHEARTMEFIVKQAPLRFGYVVLILNSFGLQHAIDNPGKAGIDKAVYFSRCLTAAKSIVNTACTALRSVLRYAPDTQIVVIAYAAVHLLKLARPTFAAYVDEDEILELVSNTADALEACAVNNMHTPALYATFLRALLQSRMERTTNGTNTPYRSRAGSPIGNGHGVAATAGLDTRTSQGGPTPGAGGLAGDGTHSGPGATSAGLDPSTAFAMPGADDSDGEQHHHSQQQQSSGPYTAAAGSGGAPGNTSTLNAAPGSSAATAALNGLDPSAFTQAALGLPVDQMLNDSFWSSLLPPGFGGPLEGTLVPNVPNFGHASSRQGSVPNAQAFFGGGNPEVGNSSAAATAALGLTPAQTRASTPSMLNTFSSNLGFDFSSGANQ